MTAALAAPSAADEPLPSHAFPDVGAAAGNEVLKTITLAEAYRMALATHESMRIADEGVIQSEAAVDKAVSQLLPKLSVEGAYTAYNKQLRSGAFVTQPDDASRVDVKLVQPVYSGGREWSARRQAKLVSKRSVAGRDEARDRVIRATAMAYFGVLKAGRDVEIKKAALKRAEERRKVAEARLKVGDVTRAVLVRAESLAAGAAADLTRVEGDLLDAKNLFRRTTGAPVDFNVSEPPLKLMNLRDVDTLVTDALGARADYRQSVIDERSADEGISYVKSWFEPSLRLEGAYSWKEQNPKTAFFQKESVSGSVVLSYPIFEGGLRSAELSEARSRYRESEQRRLSLKRDIEVQVREAVNRLNSIAAAIESYKKQLSFAEEDARMVSEQFKYGLATIVDVIDADASLVSASLSLMNANYDYEFAKLELKFSTGVLSDEINDMGAGN